MIQAAILSLAAFFLAYANGANDNAKGVATLYGSGTDSLDKALRLGHIATLLGSLAAILLVSGLSAKFSGKGLLPENVTGLPSFAVAAALGAAATVMLAARLGIPISTTHGLVGALVGAGLAAAPGALAWSQLGKAFVKPLLLSPLIAMASAGILYPGLSALRRKAGIRKDSCLCLGEMGTVPVGGAQGTRTLELMVADQETCSARYQGRVLGLRVQGLVDGMHRFSAAAVSFARGLNDAPKIAAILLLGGLAGRPLALALTAFAMLLGGWLGARRVGHTMGRRITGMDSGQGLSSNLVTSSLVIGASLLGSPVSTTHVSCGALFGMGLSTGEARWKVIAGIVLAWVATLPLAAALSWSAFKLLALA